MTVPNRLPVSATDGTNGTKDSSSKHTDQCKKPRILTCASPAVGHTMPMVRIAQELVERGFDVSFLAGDDFRDKIERAGARFFRVSTASLEEYLERRKQYDEGSLERVQYDIRSMFIDPMEERMRELYDALETLHSEDASEDIVLLLEPMFLGDHPMFLGAPLPKGFSRRPRSINISAIAYLLSSKDCPPTTLGLIPDGKPESLAVYAAQAEELRASMWAPIMALQQETLTGLGCTDYKPRLPLDVIFTSADVILQMCPPSIEYQRSDVYPTVKFVGALGVRPLKGDFQPPWFWDEVTRGDKKVIVVTQGTIATKYENLLRPTVQALANRSDVLVVGILGIRNATLPDDFVIPANTRIVDYLSYDAVLPHASVFVMNAGYGGFIHGVVNGVPMVMAGTTEDKAEVACRGEYAGVAINLRASDPTPEQIYNAVDAILSDSKYTTRVREIKEENEAMRAMDAVEKTIMEVATME